MFNKLMDKINSWEDFKHELSNKTNIEKGNAFEELVKYYLIFEPIYRTKFKHVWLRKEIPFKIKECLNLPNNDQGVDLIAETTDGEFWAIQCKYLQDSEAIISHRSISTFTSLSNIISDKISHCLVCTSASTYAKIYQGSKNISFITSNDWESLSTDFFDFIKNKSKGKEISVEPKKPFEHQQQVIDNAKIYFENNKNSRGKLILPCGAGKSLSGYFIMREFKAKSTIIAVPSLALIKQTLQVYLRECVANNEHFHWLCVCSDEDISSSDHDGLISHTTDLGGVDCTTDINYISNWLKNAADKNVLIFTTYQSGKTIADACRIANYKFELGILDEAHKTVGSADKLFSHLLFDKNITIDRRIFMTATERRYIGASDNICSMDDEKIYGNTFSYLSFQEAISRNILCDYQILTVFISNNEVKGLIENNQFIKYQKGKVLLETDARDLAKLIALRNALNQFDINHAISFHSKLDRAKSFEKNVQMLNESHSNLKKIDSYFVSGAMTVSERSTIVKNFLDAKTGLICNVKCLNEGVDVPKIDCIMFADTRRSSVDIVQAVGRALRTNVSKRMGYIILPIYTESDDPDQIVQSKDFTEILYTLRALASSDERIIEYFNSLQNNKKGSCERLINWGFNSKEFKNIDLQKFLDSVRIVSRNKFVKLAIRPFNEAREFVRGLNLKTSTEWIKYRSSPSKPYDIPTNPNRTYEKSGWINMADWLGNGNVKTEFLDFYSARSFVRKLNLKSEDEWLLYKDSKEMPRNIPQAPRSTYKDKGWIGMSDWLGNGNENYEFMNYDEAVKFIHKLKLKSNKDWRKYLKRKDRNKEIPYHPDRFYKESGWVDWGHWLGTGTISESNKEFRSFQDARSFVHTLNLKSQSGWRIYTETETFPKDIPKAPHYKYKNSGWISWGDWFGSGIVASNLVEYLNFEEARSFVRTLNLKSMAEWIKYHTQHEIKNIPRYPNQTYKNKGWKNVGDWLGVKSKNEHLNYEDAISFVHQLKLKNKKEFIDYIRGEERNKFIPYHPERTYKNSGWIDWEHWLGI